MTAVADGVINIVPNAAEQGDAIERNTDFTAPGEIHPFLGELRIDPAQARAHGGLDTADLDTRVVAASAKQQPAIRGETKVVRHPVLVTDGNIP